MISIIMELLNYRDVPEHVGPLDTAGRKVVQTAGLATRGELDEARQDEASKWGKRLHKVMSKHKEELATAKKASDLDATEHLGRAGQKGFEEMGQAAGTAAKKFGEFASEHGGAAALGAGLLGGYLLSRRKKQPVQQ